MHCKLAYFRATLYDISHVNVNITTQNSTRAGSRGRHLRSAQDRCALFGVDECRRDQPCFTQTALLDPRYDVADGRFSQVIGYRPTRPLVRLPSIRRAEEEEGARADVEKAAVVGG